MTLDFFFSVSMSGGRCCRRYLESVANGELKYRKDGRLQFADWNHEGGLYTNHFVRINADTRMLHHHGAEETAAYIVRQLREDVAGNAIQSPEVAALVCRTLLALEGQVLPWVPNIECVGRVHGEDGDWSIRIYERLLLDPKQALRMLPGVLYPDNHCDQADVFPDNLRLGSRSLARVFLETWALLLFTRDPVEYMWCNYKVHHADYVVEQENAEYISISRRILKFRVRDGSHHLVEQYTRYRGQYYNIPFSSASGSSVASSVAFGESEDESDYSLVESFVSG